MFFAAEVLTRKPQNIAIQTNPAHDLNIVDTAIPDLETNECLIHVRATGICGSDVHFWKEGGIGDSVISHDCGLGHESAGIVIKTGSAVKDFEVGDRVALECGVPCSKPTCFACRTGQYNGCPDMVFFSSPPIDGTLRRYHAHPSTWLHRIPDSMTYEEGALLEPLSVALAGIERSGLRLGDPLVICGAGPIGMVSLLAAHAAGAAPITITDLDENRLHMAKLLVPRVRTVKVERGEDPKDTAQRVKHALGQEAKLVIECTGVESSIHAGVYVSAICISRFLFSNRARQASRFGGSVFVIGVGKSFQQIPFMHASIREIDIRFLFRYRETYPKAIELVAEGLINLKPLVTHRFTLEQAKEAFIAASTPSAKAVKVQLLDN
nr:l-arabinitol 4-dehydrogenase [Quercus suber]